MQRDSENWNSFGLFGGQDPFDDPFFSRDTFNLQQTSKLQGPVIKEIDSDAEEDDAAWSNTNRNPLIEHPEDQTNGHEKSSRSNERGVNHTKAPSVSFQRVTYGGINGTYYSASTSRTSGSHGVTIEESKEADRTTGQATHRVSRGIHDKGHSVTRKLESDGKVDTVQTLHNLHEGELDGFEEAWGANTDGHFQPFANFGSTDSGFGQLAAWGERPRSPSFLLQQSGGGRPKKVVRINIE